MRARPLVPVLVIAFASLAWTIAAPSAPPASAHALASPGSVDPLLIEASPFSPAVTCGSYSLCPSMVRGAYNLTSVVNGSTTNGTGQTIVIVDACGDSSIRTDLTQFDATFHLPNATLKISHIGPGPNCHKAGWSVETALDVEWAHTIAPGARIHLVLTDSGTNSVMFSAWNYSLTNHLGNQISDSWGGPGGCDATTKSYLFQAEKQNVTVLAAAGDGGAWGAGTGVAPFMPADCNRVLTVGGTTLHVAASGGYGSETGWSYGGGGYAPRFPEPSYEVSANISDSYKALAKPDVAAVADPSTGVWVYDSSLGGWGTVGGTSVACPIWAGFVADINTLRAANGYAPLGDFESYLYGHVYGSGGSSGNYSKTMHDITKGTNGWSAGKGWDPVTGLGSMNGYPMLQQLGNDRAA